MLSIFDAFRDLSFLSVLVKLLMSFICGTIIGIERSYKRRPAGLRTHILICIGATITTLTGHYIYLCLGMPADVTRIGAQVVSGLGFIGAGTIIVTKKQKVKGLTTAAGLWASGIIGLTLGSGFYEGAILATAMVLIVDLFLLGFENRMLNHMVDTSVYITYTQKQTLDKLLQTFTAHNITMTDLKLTRDTSGDSVTFMGLFSLRYSEKTDIDAMYNDLREVPHIKTIQKL